MSKRNSLPIKMPRLSIALAAALLLALVIGGCGGETRGTGGFEVQGRLLDSNGVALNAVMVSSGDASTITDSAGNFTLLVNLPASEQITLSFDNSTLGLSTAASVEVLPGQDALDLAVTIDVPENKVVQISHVGIPTPTAQATAQATPAPSSTATATATAAPTQNAPTAVPTQTATPGPCPADFNQDGQVDSQDLSDFNAAFDLGDISADFDKNGFVNGDDADAFAVAYASGC